MLEKNTYNLKSKWEQTHVNSLALQTKLTEEIVERDRECSSHVDREIQTLETADLGSVLACAWLLSSGQAGVAAVLQASSIWCHNPVLKSRAPTEEKEDLIKYSFNEELEQIFDPYARYHTKILLGDFKDKVGQEDIFKSWIAKQRLYKIISVNGVKLENFTTPKKLSEVQGLCKIIWTPY